MNGSARVAVAAIVSILCLGSAAQAMPIRPPDVAVPTGSSTRSIGVLPGKLAAALHRSGPVRWVGQTEATVTPVPCADDPPFLCGSIRVPIDRADPNGRTIRIGFQIFPHTDPEAAAIDPIFVSTGGPGGSTTGDRYGWAYWVLSEATAERDLVMVDHRGTGTSEPIRCRDLQNGYGSTPEYFRGIRRCAAQLGDDADRYGTGDIAMDVDAVREALGYDVIDFFAVSYGTVVEQAYATRFPEHLRAIVADGGLPVTDPEHAWGWGLDQPTGLVRSAALSCERAPTCDSQIADPSSAFAALVDRLQDEPLMGRGRDVFGELHRVVIGPQELAWMAYEPRIAAEIPASAVALLEHGDERPLLRLGAEGIEWPGPQAASSFSEGAHVATYCNDQDFVMDRTATRAVRRQQYLDAKAALPADTFAPWTVDGWDTDGYLGLCSEWAAPERFEPAVPENAPLIDMPTLVLEGDFDADVPMETNDRLAELFAHPTVVRVQGAGHTTGPWSVCAHVLIARFIDTLAVGDTSCADTPSVVLQALGLFPMTSADALEASPRTGDESTARDRRAVWSSVQAVIDAWLRSFRQPAAVADGAGLRGGWFHADYSSDDHGEITLHAARFVRDVAVRGRSTLAYDSDHPRLRARLTIRGAGTARGAFVIAGRWYFDTIFGDLRVTGRIGGREVALTVLGN
jgi:pimeloyl-ACP methyl ester carboxylesterase